MTLWCTSGFFFTFHDTISEKSLPSADLHLLTMRPGLTRTPSLKTKASFIDFFKDLFQLCCIPDFKCSVISPNAIYQ